MVDIPGNITTTARFVGDVQVAASCSGASESANDSDWIRLDLVAGTTYRFFGRNLTPGGVSGGTDLLLFDAHGVELARGCSNGSLGSLSFTATASGIFFIDIRDLHGAKGDYTVDVVSSDFHGKVVIDSQVVDAGTDADHYFASAGPGDDWLQGTYLASDLLFGGSGDDEIVVGPGDHLEGPKLEEPDKISGTTCAGDGADDVLGSYVADTIYGEDGNDVFDGRGGSDTIFGGAGDDVLRGGAGSDRLSGGPGADIMIGGLHGDTYFVDNAADVVDETGPSTARPAIDIVYASISFSLIESAQVKGAVENLTLTAGGNIDGTGNALANEITGNGGLLRRPCHERRNDLPYLGQARSGPGLLRHCAAMPLHSPPPPLHPAQVTGGRNLNGASPGGTFHALSGKQRLIRQP